MCVLILILVFVSTSGIADNAANIASNSAAISSNDGDILSISNDVAAATRCTGILTYDGYCCTAANPCGPNQGDCDNDDECSGDLRCGTNNCFWDVGGGADCCYLETVWFDAYRYGHFIKHFTAKFMTVTSRLNICKTFWSNISNMRLSH